MKTPLLGLATLSLLLLVSCTRSPVGITSSEKEVKELKENLSTEQDAYLKDIEIFKKESTEKVAANQIRITDFNKRVSVKREALKAEYREKTARLEVENNDMQKRIDAYVTTGREDWENFKTTFNHDMVVLNDALVRMNNREAKVQPNKNKNHLK